jgi:hypothetical protein
MISKHVCAALFLLAAQANGVQASGAVLKSSCSLVERFSNTRERAIKLIDGCGEEEGLGGGFVGRKLKTSLKTPRAQRSKVNSGGWLMSVSLFLSLDLSPEVRTREGNISPSWPVLLGLRGAKSVLKTADW